MPLSHRTNASLTSVVCVVLSYVLLIALIAPLIFTAGQAASANTARTNPSGAESAGEVLVRFRPEVTEDEKNALARAGGVRRGGRLRGAARIERLELMGGQTPQMLMQQLAAQPSVEWAEPNYLISRDDLIPNDVRFDEQWALRNSSGNAGSQTGADIAAPLAWERTTGSPALVVAVIDSGVDFTHADLSRNQWINRDERANNQDDDRDGYVDDLNGWDWAANSNLIKDEQGHGTSVAGIIAAEGNNGVGTAGVMWRASLMSLRVLDATGTGDVADAVEAIDYAVAHGAQVINLSWGLETQSLALRDALERAASRGVVVVCSAGNGGGRNLDSQPYYPASYDLPNVIAVAATDSSDNLTSWSNWAATRVAVAAPGVDILTTQMGGGYANMSGTSAAAPLVTGIAGLLRSAYPGLSARDTRASIVSGARRVAGLNGKVAAGGVAQAAGALAKAGDFSSNNGGGNGNGDGNGNGGGNGNGNGGENGGDNGGNGQWHAQSPKPDKPGRGSGGRGPGGGFDAPASAPVKAAPANFMDQDEVRRRGAVAHQARSFIQSNSMPYCDADCESYSVGGAGGSDPYFATARNLPANRTGASAEVDPGSRNFNWNTPLVGLAGRNGLDINLALHYNSLVWTRQGNSVQYNADHGFPGPGFHLGLPTLQARYLNSNTGTSSYTMVTSSGGRVEMGQLGASNTYESADGSNTQLVEYYQVVARHSGKCLDVSGVSQSNGASLHQWDCYPVQNQQWQLVPTDNGYYKIIARHSGKAIDVNGAGQQNGNGVSQWEDGGWTNQQWQVVPADNGYYRITARHSGKSLDVAGASSANGGAIHQWDYVGGANQQWQLVPVAGQVVVRTSDGTELTFVYNSTLNEYRCTQVKDRNGNFITINYGAINGNSSLGRPTSIVDTLGRTISFNYNAQNYLETITQAWAREATNGTTISETHEWARFHYGTIALDPNFEGLSVVAPATGTSLPVLVRVDLQDKSSFKFEYEAAWGMVRRISHYGPDPASRLINYTSYNLPTRATPQTDCPRFTERRDWATDWNNDQEAVTTYAMTQNATWLMNNAQQTGTRMTVTSPIFYDKDGVTAKRVVEKIYSYATGWSAGLPMQTETYEWSAATGTETLQRTVVTGWTQDDINLPYPKNPRPWEHRITDPDGNLKRTTINYTVYSLPADVYEYAADGQTVLRRTQTSYNLDPAYINRRIIGLPVVRQMYDEAGALVSKIGYGYDSGGGSSQWIEDAGPATQHDRANYGQSFDVGRGNLSWLVRYAVNDPDNATGTAAVSGTGYNITGSVTWQSDPSGHYTSRLSYTDSFSTTGHPATYAYPTRVTDAADFHSTVQYNYALGAVHRATDPRGAAQTTHYDEAGRVLRSTNAVNGFYTRYEYDPNYQHTRTYTLSETGELYTNTILNGAGQVYLSVASNPHSAGGYLATVTRYDALGRAVEQTNPTEITSGGIPAGDDAAGYRLTKQAYDWRGRPTLTTLPAVAGQAQGNTRELTYGGCGCAGGESVTFRDERGRRRKLYKDVLGRLARVEELNWDTSVYATTYYSYNGRDQLTNINQAGLSRGFGYDGHGRLLWRSTPEQGATHYGYHGDDTLAWVSDSRGVATHYNYNSRHLVTSINYGVPPNSEVTATSNVTFEYDAAGNRTSRYNGVELRQYTYDQMSRLDSEYVNFPTLNQTWHRIKYDYNLAGQLKRVTNPWGVEVSYAYDANGRATDVTGANYANVSTYASNLRYRAFGGMKAMSYGNGKTLALSYDERLRLKTWNVAGVLGWNYRYDNFLENSHRVTYAQNISSGNQAGTPNPDPSLDRSYDYDHLGRLRYAHTGVEARMHAFNQPHDGGAYGPYAQHTYQDIWGNPTQRYGWGGANPSDSATYDARNRRVGLSYDEAGNVTQDGQGHAYDAEGQETYASIGNLSQAYDGERLRVKKAENGYATYYLRSSVLGGRVVAELNWQGLWQRGYVYLGGQLLAMQSGGVQWVHQDPVVKSQRLSDASGALTAVVETDAWGGETTRSWQQWQQPQRYTSYLRDANESDEAMHRRYNRWWGRFNQPDPSDGSYDLGDPQSLNRYSYVQNDPVNYVDPSGLNAESGGGGWSCSGTWRGERTPGGTIINFQITSMHCISWDGEGSGQQNPTPEQSAATRAAELLQQQRCANFVRSVYDNAIDIAGGRVSFTGITPTNDTLLGLDGRPIPRPQTPATVSLDAYNVALAAGRVSASGADEGTAVGQTTNNNTITWNNAFYDLGVDERARHTIHEGFHQIPNLDDFVLLQAAARAAGVRTPRATTGREASRLFNDILFPRCGGR